MNEPQLTGPSYGPVSKNKPAQLVLLLHGRGADGNDLIGLAPMLAAELPDALFLAPNAPHPCDGAPFGRQWFSLIDRTPENIAAGVRAAAAGINAFLDYYLARHGLTEADLALFGFSQGSMMALHIGMRRPLAPAAVLGYSGMLAAADSLASEITVRPRVLLVHGEADEIVPHAALGMAEAALRDVGVDVEVVSRPGLGHGIDDEGIARAVAVLAAAFGS